MVAAGQPFLSGRSPTSDGQYAFRGGHVTTLHIDKSSPMIQHTSMTSSPNGQSILVQATMSDDLGEYHKTK